ncbi:MAG: tetratricopeptide repeat protein [Cyanobacteria bacterium SZAS LIN-3]|nr:tetratricopeptide repeat protein [Cyanobacteria bacterium SZAS LIN-3]
MPSKSITKVHSIGLSLALVLSLASAGLVRAQETDAAYQERLKAAEIEREQRQNEAVQHYEAARVYLSGGNTEMAELELQAAIMNGPSIRAFHRDYCLVALLRGHPMRALAEAMMVVGLGDAIPLNEEQTNKLKAQGCKLHYRRGIELAGKQNWKNAITEFQWALEYKPNNATVMRSMAFANASLGNIELAEKQYGSSFSADPSDAYGHADLAYLLEGAGKGPEALKQLQAAVKLQPKVAALHIDLGWLAETNGDLGEAEGEFEEAVKLSPKHASLWTHLGKIQARQGKADKAAEAYKMALSLDPGASDAEIGLQSLKQAGPQGGSAEPVAPGAKPGPHAPQAQPANQAGGSVSDPKFIIKRDS